MASYLVVLAFETMCPIPTTERKTKQYKTHHKNHVLIRMEVHAYNLSTVEAEAGGSPQLQD